MNLCIAILSVFTLLSPDSKLEVKIETGDKIQYSIISEGKTLIAPSEISMSLTDGTQYGGRQKVIRTSKRQVKEVIPSPIYKNSHIPDHYNELNIGFKQFSLVFRVYDEGVAYRFISKSKKPFEVLSEQAVFNFPEDWKAWVPYVRTKRQTIEEQFTNSFENTYQHICVSEWDKSRIAFLPVTIDVPGGKKVCITESDLRNYPGLYLYNGTGTSSLTGINAPYPKRVEQGGYINIQGIVKEREDFIAKAEAFAAFPWRVIIVAGNAAKLTENNLSYLLGAPAEKIDWSWVKPGKVAWDWWNDWNLRNVDFKAGINNRTYEYYIDFASSHNVGYVILDDGWSVTKDVNLFHVVPEIDIPHLVEYGAKRNVGIILWAGYWPMQRDMEEVCKHYSEIGVKGFKVDFMNRDDQQMVQFYEKLAQTAAKYKLLIDYHGAYKPAGLNRTYPNAINFEGVFGLEQAKFSGNNKMNQVEYDVTIPYTRFLAGPADYTQGAMRNANRKNFFPCYSEPMSQGTRCHQLAEYVVFDAPLSMLCDSPSNYIEEAECTEFITGIPVIWDETRGLAGEIGEFVVIARRSGQNWWIGALTNWEERDIEIDFSFLNDGRYSLSSLEDGINANQCARDYVSKMDAVSSKDKRIFHLASGGGFAIQLTPLP